MLASAKAGVGMRAMASEDQKGGASDTPASGIYARIDDIVAGPDGVRWLEALVSLRSRPLRLADRAMADELVALGIGRRVPEGIALTVFGFKCADSAREYVRWTGRKRRMHYEDEHLATRLENFRGQDVLELGSGWGCNLIRIATVARSAVGLELEPAYVQFSRMLAKREALPPPSIAMGACESLPFRNGSFDWILLMAVLQYTAIDKTIQECGRVLRPGGSVLISHVLLYHFIRDGLANAVRNRNLRSLGWLVMVAVNTLWYELSGRRLLENIREYATARPIHSTKRYLAGAGARAGLVFNSDLSAKTKGQWSLLVLQKPLSPSA
jgi:SAM-dependent methyltransferase